MESDLARVAGGVGAAYAVMPGGMMRDTLAHCGKRGMKGAFFVTNPETSSGLPVKPIKPFAPFS